MIFRAPLATAIMRHQKTATRRQFSDNERSPWWEGGCKYSVGQVFAVQPGRGVVRLGTARLMRVDTAPLCAVTPADARKEGFGTRDAFVDAWRAINGSWDPDERVHVLEFVVVDRHRYLCLRCLDREGGCQHCADGTRDSRL